MEDGLELTTPATRDYAFGGTRLTRYGKHLEGRTAETWEFSLYPGRPSRLAGGQTLDAHLAQAWGLAPHERAALPLIKLLDVQGDLPVHCHPGDREAGCLAGDDPGKDEAWLVLETGPDAAIFLGFDTALDDATMLGAIRGEGLRPYMKRYVPQAGDVVMVPAGTAHAARDIVIYEVQQTSDRGFMAETVDLWGRPYDPKTAHRQWQAFMRCARRTPPPPALYASGVFSDADRPDGAFPLVGCDHFATEVWQLETPQTLPAGAYTVLAGRVGAAGRASAGDTFLLGPQPSVVAPWRGPARLVRAWRADRDTARRLGAVGRHFEPA